MGRSIFSSSQNNLSARGVLGTANGLLENARKTKDNHTEVLSLCNDAKSKLKDVETILASNRLHDQGLENDIVNAYHEHAKLLDDLGYHEKAQESHNIAQELGYVYATSQQSASSQTASISTSISRSIIPSTAFAVAPAITIKAAQTILDFSATKPNNQNSSQQPPLADINTLTHQTDEDREDARKNIFDRNVRLPVIKQALPVAGARITSTPQLVYCLGLLQPSLVPADQLNEIEIEWLHVMDTNLDERERLQAMATDLIRAFLQDELKKPDTVAEVVSLTPVLDRVDFEKLLKVFVDSIESSILLDMHLLDGLARLLKDARPGYIDSDNLVKILKHLSARLIGNHNRSVGHSHQLSVTVSHVLDSMVDSQVEVLEHEQVHELLLGYLKSLQSTSDPSLLYQSAYAHQALQYILDDKTIIRSMLRRTGKLFQGISGMVSAAKAVDINLFIKGLQTIQDSLAAAGSAIVLLRDAYSVNKSAWYLALRGLDALLQEGRLHELETLIWEAPCRHDPAFQWGVCQRLGELSANTLWDINTRQCAISFLGEVYHDDLTWRKEDDIKKHIHATLLDLTHSSDTKISGHARDNLQKLEASGSRIGQDSLAKGGEYPSQCLSSISLTPQTSPLLDSIQNKPDVEVLLRQLRRDRLKERSVDVYISPRATANNKATEDFDLRSKVQEFLDGNKKVFLILGNSGSGKSTFNRALEISLWESYKAGGRIPLFVYLPTIDKLEHDLIAEHLHRHGFTEEQIRELKLYREFILICDGYDECQTIKNLYSSNQLNRPGNWRAQMVISCRIEYTGVDYIDQFRPASGNIREKLSLYQEMIVAPFNMDQIQEYINQYVSNGKTPWRLEEYLQALQQIPNLRDLVTNPFLLKLSLDVLPRLVKLESNFRDARITRVGLYDKFLSHWVDRSKIRFGEIDLSDNEKRSLRTLLSCGFKGSCTTYMKELAAAIYEHQNGNPVVKFIGYQDQETWKAQFFDMRDENSLLQQAIPLIHSGNQYRFIHRSVLEYGLSQAIFDPTAQEEFSEQPASLSRRSSSSSLSFNISSARGEATDVIEQVLLDSPLGKRNFVRDVSILAFLVERVQHHPRFKDQLLAVIQRTKTDTSRKAQLASTNAITVLVRAEIPFYGTDLRGIKIPGADLSHGVFDSVRFEGADLRNIRAQSIWLRQANLNGALATNIQFGELPYLQVQEVNAVSAVAYSPNGELFIVGSRNGNISTYETSSWDKVRMVQGHAQLVGNLEYLKTKKQIISGSYDSTVRLWDADTFECIHTFEGHADKVTSIAHSPEEDRVISGSADSSVRVWNVETGICIQILECHSGVTSVIYSPTGYQFASTSEDNTIRLWDAQTNNCTHTLESDLWAIPVFLKSCIQAYGDISGDRIMYSPKGDRIISRGTMRLWDAETGTCIQALQGHNLHATSISYSPVGDLIASGGLDRTVRLWDVGTGKCIHILQGHAEWVTKTKFSLQGSQVVSISADYTLQLWDVETGNCLQSLQGHGVTISSVVFSPIGNQIASGGIDGKVRLWNSKAKNYNQIKANVGQVSNTMYSPSGDQIASTELDGRVRLWDAKTGDCLQTFLGHTAPVHSVKYSPKGDHIISGSADSTVRFWDIESGGCSKVLQGHSDRVCSVAYSPKGNQIATGSWDKTIKLWDADAGKCVRTLEGHTDQVSCVAYSPNGDTIASASQDSTLRLWDVETGGCLKTFQHIFAVLSVGYSPVRNQVATGSLDTSVRVWDVETGDCIQYFQGQMDSTVRDGSESIQGHARQVFSIAYSQDGDYVVSGGGEGTVRLWSIETGQLLLVIAGFTAPVFSIDWKDTVDGQYLVTGSGDKSVRNWRIVKEGGKHKAYLYWSSSHTGLTVADAVFSDDLEVLDRKLVTQRGAIINSYTKPE